MPEIISSTSGSHFSSISSPFCSLPTKLKSNGRGARRKKDTFPSECGEMLEKPSRLKRRPTLRSRRPPKQSLRRLICLGQSQSYIDSVAAQARQKLLKSGATHCAIVCLSLHGIVFPFSVHWPAACSCWNALTANCISCQPSLPDKPSTQPSSRLASAQDARLRGLADRFSSPDTSFVDSARNRHSWEGQDRRLTNVVRIDLAKIRDRAPVWCGRHSRKRT